MNIKDLLMDVVDTPVTLGNGELSIMILMSVVIYAGMTLTYSIIPDVSLQVEAVNSSIESMTHLNTTIFPQIDILRDRNFMSFVTNYPRIARLTPELRSMAEHMSILTNNLEHLMTVYQEYTQLPSEIDVIRPDAMLTMNEIIYPSVLYVDENTHAFDDLTTYIEDSFTRWINHEGRRLEFIPDFYPQDMLNTIEEFRQALTELASSFDYLKSLLTSFFAMVSRRSRSP